MSKKKKSKSKHTWHFYVGIFCVLGAVVMLFSNIWATLFYAIIAVALLNESSRRKPEKAKETRGPEAFAEEQAASKKKKPVYKRWWFWALLVVALIGGGQGNKEDSLPAETQATDVPVIIETTPSAIAETEETLPTEVTEAIVTEATEAAVAETTEAAAAETTEATVAETTEATVAETEVVKETEYQTTYVLNTNSQKFHYPSCSSADDIKASNKSTFTGDRSDLLARGYSPCGRCHP